MAISLKQKILLALLIGIALIGGLIAVIVIGPASPASRASSHTLTMAQELTNISPFIIIDQQTESKVDINGCYINTIIFRIGSPVSLSDSTSLFIEKVRNIGWKQQSGNFGSTIYYFQRNSGELLVLYTENYGIQPWKGQSDLSSYSSILYVVVATGNTYFKPCTHF